MISIKIKETGKWTNPTQALIFPLTRAMKRTTEIVRDTAKEFYMQKRITDKTPSLIFDSIVDADPVIIGKTAVRGIVYAGGPKPDGAYYAKWVDKGHKMRNGVWWEGHHFLKAGMEAGERVVEMIIHEELSK